MCAHGVNHAYNIRLYMRGSLHKFVLASVNEIMKSRYMSVHIIMSSAMSSINCIVRDNQIYWL